jgi:hypothetical protein
VARTTGARHFHGSIRRIVLVPRYEVGREMNDENGPGVQSRFVVEREDVRAMIENLTNA